MKFHPLLLVALLIPLQASQAHADLIVEFQNISMNPGTNSSIDVFVRSDGLTVDNVGLFGLKFGVSKIGDGNGTLNFRSSFVDGGQIDSETTAANYIFASDSGAFASTRDASNRLLLSQSDLSRTFVGRAIPTAVIDRLLIARLELDHDSDGSLAGGTFRIALLDGSSFTANDFVNSVNINSGLSNFGTVTITGVPEPSSGLIVLIAIGLAFGGRGRLRRSYRNICLVGQAAHPDFETDQAP